ncbi:MAG: DNA polymerase IV [Anaerolineales bacterium]|nr:DNA polymerase IV [Anaerolineales bacterium]
MKRTILHTDLDAFFCAVEILQKPDLVDVPFVVGGSPSGRGVVSSASYPARVYGIRSAMPTAQALRLCPNLIVLQPRHKFYSEASQNVMDILHEVSPIVEQISIDEAFLDISDDPEPGISFARRIQSRIKNELGLPTSWGIATNKLVAKIATDQGKPEGLVEVKAGEEAAFLAPLPVDVIWGVGPRTQEMLAQYGVKTVGDLAIMDRERLKNMFGERGADLTRHAHGIDERPVSVEYERRSLSCERTFSTDLKTERQMVRILQVMSEELGARLRKEDLYASTVRLKIRRPDFSTFSRQIQLQQPTDQDREIFQAAKQLLRNVNAKEEPVRLLGVALSGLSEPIRQLNLFDHSWEKEKELLKALDGIREKYGPDAVKKAARLRKRNQ